MTVDTQELMDAMARMVRENEPFALATIVRTEDATSAKAGAKAVVRMDGSLTGWIGGGCTQGAVKRAARQALEDGKSRMIRVRPVEKMTDGNVVEGVEQFKSSCPSGGTVDLFIEPMLPRPTMVVVGGSPVARALADLAGRMGYALTVAALPDDQASFDEADRRIVDVEFAPDAVPADAFIVVATQGKRDRAALKAALATPVDYVAFIGSRRKGAKLKDVLRTDAADDARIDRLRSPAGLNIGAITPAEIALSVLAEITQLRRQNVRRVPAPDSSVEEVEGAVVETNIVGDGSGTAAKRAAG